MTCTTIDTPLGPLTLVSDGDALAVASFGDVPDAEPGTDAILDAASDQLARYFDGEPVTFDVPIRAGGTPFQERVWAALCAIPHGETISYGTLAGRIGMPKGAQAVGAANGQNPVAIVVPCHRVVGADGALVGYAGGLERKRALLDLESPQRSLF